MQDQDDWLKEPRYRDNPLLMFFECLVLDVLGKLPDGDREWVECQDLWQVFDTEEADWREVLHEELDLSATIDTAIWHAWVREHGHYYDTYDGHVAFAQDFTDAYLDDDSDVDVWSGAQLARAVEEVAAFRKRNVC